MNFEVIKKSIKTHAPEICVGTGLVSMTVGLVLAVKVTPNAAEAIENRKKELSEENNERNEDIELTKTEMVKTAWRLYLPAALTFASGVGCVLVGTIKNSKDKSGYAAAYALTESRLASYSSSVKEKVSEKAHKDILDLEAEKEVKERPVSTNQVIITGHGETLIYDQWSKRYFETNIDNIDKAKNELNAKLLSEGEACINDFYEAVGLPPTDIGEDFKWHVITRSELVDIHKSAQIADNGQPCICISFSWPPTYC